MNRKLDSSGIRVLPLKVRKGRALIYVYRPNALECDLADHRYRGLLLQWEQGKSIEQLTVAG